MRRIGVLTFIAAYDTVGQARLAAFTHALSQLGWSEGRNLRIDTRWATAGDVHRHVAELVALAPDVLVAASGTATVAPLLQATKTIPIAGATLGVSDASPALSLIVWFRLAVAECGPRCLADRISPTSCPRATATRAPVRMLGAATNSAS